MTEQQNNFRPMSLIRAAASALLLLSIGCATTGTKSTLNDLKEAASEEANPPKRSAKSAVSATEILRRQPVQDFRDSVIP